MVVTKHARRLALNQDDYSHEVESQYVYFSWYRTSALGKKPEYEYRNLLSIMHYTADSNL